MNPWTPEFIALVAVTFFLGGFVKGVVGFGPPLMAVAIIAPLYGIQTALALVIVPTFVMNIFQAFQGDAIRPLASRLLPYLVTTVMGITIGVGILASARPDSMRALLGLILVVYAVASLANMELPAPGRHERYVTPAVGLLSGTLAGMTGVYVFPTALYLRALGLDRDALIQSMGVIFLVATLALGINLGGRNLLPGGLAAMSVLAIVPALVGQWIGRRVRHRLPEATFRLVFLLALAVVGAGIFLRAVVA
ncbi:MAG: sulfite exporter TauE/SafE family protein [Hyphomicrobiaceae bacterium]|nr:sulfite exporter TauE/SafE family protein [Hyphomicrobiaceae bacterium]